MGDMQVTHEEYSRMANNQQQFAKEHTFAVMPSYFFQPVFMKMIDMGQFIP